MRPFNPVKKFAVLSSVFIIGLCLGLAFAISYLLEHQMREGEWRSTAEIVKHQMEEHNLALYLTESRPRREPAEYQEIFKRLSTLPEVVRIKVWDREATVLWSDDERLIGKRFPENQELKQALAGRVSVALKTLRKAENVLEREQFTRLAEIYVPIPSKPSGEIIGVIEVYKFPALLFADIQRMRALVWGIVLTGGILLYGGLVPIVRRSHRRQLELERNLQEYSQHLELEVIERKRAEAELRRAHDELDIRVQERTAELLEANERLRDEITRRERAEQELRLQAVALQTARNAIVITDSKGTIVWVNEAFTELTGYTAEEVLGQTPRLLKSGRQDQSLYQKLWETILSGRAWHGEMINRRKDGSLFVEEQIITPVNDERGAISHFIAIKQDITERKRAEEALRETNGTLEAVVEASPMGITILDSDGNVKLWNPAAERIFGWRQEEVLGRRLPTIPADKREEHRSFRERVLRGEAFSDAAIVRQKKDGSLIDISLSTAPLRDTKGHIWGAMGIMADITERKQSEEALTLFRSLIDHTNDAIEVIDPDTGRFLDVNEKACQAHGYTREEYLTLTVPEIDPVVGARPWAEIREEVRRSGSRIYDTQHRRKDGSVFPVEVNVTYIRLDRDYLLAVVRDITERKQAEAIRQALYQASLHIQEPLGLQERLDRLLQIAQTVLALDRINILLADKEGQELRAVASLGVDEPLDAIRVPIGAAGGALAEAYRTHQVIIWDDRAPLPEALRLQPPFDQIAALRSRVFAIVPLVVQGRAIGVLGVDRKHSQRAMEPAMLELLQLFASQAALAIEHARLYETQRMAATELEATVETRTRELQAANLLLQETMGRVEEASSHKSEFLANMSHELRTPLNSILGFSELLQQQTYGPLTVKQDRYVANIHTSGLHLLALINDLLDLSKVEAGKIELRPATFEVREALAAALAEIRPQAEATRLHLQLQMDEPPLILTADPVRFKQIVYNLLSNAVKFTPEGGRVTVTARRVHSSQLTVDRARTTDREPSTVHPEQPGDYVEIAVADTGIGIRREDLPKLFQVFTQLQSTYVKQHQGTGLGLALTKLLVELHGGTVEAASAGEGQGSTFTVRLPLLNRKADLQS